MVLKIKGRGGGVGKQNLSHNSFVLKWPSQILLRIVGIRGKRGGIKQIRGTRSNRLFMDI